MRKFIKYLLIIILFSVWGIVLTNQDQTRETVQSVSQKVSEAINPPCSKPLKYAIGRVDSNFNLTEDKFLEIVKEAEGIWEEPTGKNLFEYDARSDFKINLIFDERQIQSLEAEELQGELSELEETRGDITDEYNSLQKKYQKEIKEYEKDLKEYEDKLEEYNKKVKEWNKKGGSQEEYEDLQKDQEKLEDLYDDLKDRQKEINKLASESNKLAREEGKVVNEYNANVATYKNKHGNAREFEKGVFEGTEISIYQFQERSDLRLTLAHELGHYLNLDHVDNSASLMYYLMGDQDLENPTLTEEDLAELDKICGE